MAAVETTTMDRVNARHGRTEADQHQVAIAPEDEWFLILVDGDVVARLHEEIEAHHWAKHVVECVHSGVTEPRHIREALPRLCEVATRNNLHTGYPPPRAAS